MKQIARRTFLFLLVAVGSATASVWADDSPATEPVTNGLRLCMAGHSFHMGIVPVMEEIALNAGITNQVVAGKLFVGGSRTIQVWNRSETESNVRAALQAGQVDVLTLSPHRQLPDPGIDMFVDFGLAGNPHLRVTVQQSWMPYDDPTGQPLTRTR